MQPGQGEELVRPLSSNRRGPYDLSKPRTTVEELDQQGPGPRGRSMEAELEAEQPTPHTHNRWVRGLELSLAEHGQRPIQPCKANAGYGGERTRRQEETRRGKGR